MRRPPPWPPPFPPFPPLPPPPPPPPAPLIVVRASPRGRGPCPGQRPRRGPCPGQRPRRGPCPPNRDRDDILPLLIAMGGTEGNMLPLLLLASRFRGSAILHEIGEREEDEEAREERAEVDDLRLEVAAE